MRHRKYGLSQFRYFFISHFEQNMLRYALYYILIGVLPSIHAATREYVDALGVKHSTDKDKPKIVTWSHRAVSMAHYGQSQR